MDLTQVLLNCQSVDANLRVAAENFLKDAQKHNFPAFLQMLCVELANNDKPVTARQQAGIQLKNSLTAKSEATRLELAKAWVNVDVSARSSIKNACLSCLGSTTREVRSTAAMVVAAIGIIELPHNLWPELIKHLLANMTSESSENLRQATLECIGYICEDTDPNVLAYQSNDILTAVCKGIRENNLDIKFAGCKALYNSLEFIKSNMEKGVERDYIMQVLCESAICTTMKIRVVALECLAKIATLYYDKLASYMQKLFEITLNIIRSDEEEAALQAVEFWSSICDEEMALLEEAEIAKENNEKPDAVCLNFIKGALQYLVPVLTEALTKQPDEPDEDTWNLSMASATCLSLVAATVNDEVLPFVVPFVEKNILSENWKLREAATICFGAVLDGPTKLENLIVQALPVLLNHMKDPVVFVKDTTAWVIGRICQLHGELIVSGIEQLLTVLVTSLGDTPKVASNSAWAIHNLAIAFEDEKDEATNGLSKYWAALIEKLLQVADREDSDESNLRTSAYEAINVLVHNGAQDVLNLTSQLVPVFADRLAKTFQLQILSMDDKEAQHELQCLLCGVLQVLIQKLGAPGIKNPDLLMEIFIQVFHAKSAAVYEEALMAVGALANAIEGNFDKYMKAFLPVLLIALKNCEDYQVCIIAVGIVGDISRAIGVKMTPYCDDILNVLVPHLSNNALNRNIKPPILSVFGDIGMAIEDNFVKYLTTIMNILVEASAITVEPTDQDLVDYLNELRTCICEGYTGIIQGLRSAKKADLLVPYAKSVLSFLAIIAQDQNRTDDVVKSATGVLGDLAHALGNQIRSELTQAQVIAKTLIDECNSRDADGGKEIAQWAKEVVTKAMK